MSPLCPSCLVIAAAGPPAENQPVGILGLVLFIIFATVVSTSVIYLNGYLVRPRESDEERIDEQLENRGWEKVRQFRETNFMRYWLHGAFMLGSSDRIYVVIAKDRAGALHEIHLAFYLNWPRAGKIRILLERPATPKTLKTAEEEADDR